MRGLLRASDLQVGDEFRQVELPEPEMCHSPQYLPDEDIGWFIGMYLAEGSKSGGCIQISSHVKEIKRYENLKRIAKNYGGVCKMYNTHGKSATINIYCRVLNAVIDIYIAGRIAKTKGLSTACWRRSNQFLSSLLRGYLEGDGHWDEKNCRWRLGFTRNPRLANDLRTICARLKILIRINPIYSWIGRVRYAAYRGEIRFRWKSIKKNPNKIAKIERYKDIERYWDVEVEAENGEFALASGILTHNSKPNPMPSPVLDRLNNVHEAVYMFVKNNDPIYYYNVKTGLMADKKPKELKEGIDWDWGDVGEEYSECDTKIPIGESENLSSPRARVYRKKELKKISYWRSMDYWFDLDSIRKLHKEESLKRVKGNWNGHREPMSAYQSMDIKRMCNLLGKNPGDIFDIPTCGYPGAHFACFPEALISPLIKCSCPAKVCSKCGKPQVRIVKVHSNRTESELKKRLDENADKGYTIQDRGYAGIKGLAEHGVAEKEFIGWSDCKCGEKFVPGLVLDPFSGASTTGLVARKLQRDFVGIEISEAYCKLGADRINKEIGTLFGEVEIIGDYDG